MNIHGTRIQLPHIFQKFDIRTEFLPGDIGNRFGKCGFGPVKKLGHIRCISGDSTRGKVTKRKDVGMLIKVVSIYFIHEMDPPVKDGLQ